MIETELKRIADSLEIIADVLDDKAVKSFAAEVLLPECQDVVPAPAPKTALDEPKPGSAAAATPAPAPKAAAPKAVPAPAPAPETTVQMELAELDAALLVEYNRLNKDRTLIDAVIKGFGVNTATELAPTDYQAVLDKVKAL